MRGLLLGEVEQRNHVPHLCNVLRLAERKLDLLDDDAEALYRASRAKDVLGVGAELECTQLGQACLSEGIEGCDSRLGAPPRRGLSDPKLPCHELRVVPHALPRRAKKSLDIWRIRSPRFDRVAHEAAQDTGNFFEYTAAILTEAYLPNVRSGR